MQSFRIQLQKHLPTFDEVNEINGISAQKFEAARIHFLSDVFGMNRTPINGWKLCSDVSSLINVSKSPKFFHLRGLPLFLISRTIIHVKLTLHASHFTRKSNLWNALLHRFQQLSHFSLLDIFVTEVNINLTSDK